MFHPRETRRNAWLDLFEAEAKHRHQRPSRGQRMSIWWAGCRGKRPQKNIVFVETRQALFGDAFHSSCKRR